MPRDVGTASNFEKYERYLIFTLAFVQVTHIMDFVIMMPLGPQLMRAFSIDAKGFAFLVSSYTFSSGFFGFLGSFVIDRFDRKKALLAAYCGFLIGTFLCALSSNYVLLLLARIFAGAFGGVMNALVFTIVGDVIPLERRGRATGTVMAAFSISSIAGVPIGLYIASLFDWHAPFFLLVVLGSLNWANIFFKLKPMNRHVNTDAIDIRKLYGLVSDVNHQRAFLLTGFLVLGAFSVIPFLSPYLVNNAKLPESKLPLMYFCGGCATFFTSRLFGRLADKQGMFKTFLRVALASTIPLFAITRLPPLQTPLIILVSTLFMVLVSGRYVPAMTLITSCAAKGQRGSFMSLNNAVQHLSSGTATLIAGSLLTTTPSGRLEGFGTVGLFAIGATLLSVLLARKIHTTN